MNYDTISSRFDERIKTGMKESTGKITTAVGTIKDSLENYLATNKDKPVSDLTAGIKEKFDTIYTQSSAKRIAQTTSTFTTNKAQKEAWHELGYERQWVCTGAAAKPRGEHLAADRQREVAGTFDVAGESVSQPGDGSAENSINCHCTTLPVKKLR